MNQKIINEFISAWNAMDIEAIMLFFSDDAVYTNIPMGPPNRGKQEIRDFIKGFIATATQINFIIHNQVEGPNGIIMNERSDTFILNGQSVNLPVMGVFEIKEGKIKAWRDYFDMKLLQGLGF